jgi:hypothetical protein
MSNLGPHLRHNRHHTLLLMQEQPCSQSVLHLHDQQPTSKDFSKYWLSYDSLISLYGLTTCLFIGFTTGKTLNKCAQKWLQIHADHWLQIRESQDFVTVDSKSDYQSTTSWPSFGLQSVATHPPVDLLLVDLFDLLSMPLPCRTASTFDFDFTRSTNLNLRLVVDLPRPFDLLSIHLDFDRQSIHLD